MISEERLTGILKELKFRTSRSSGKGGQHVNTTESKVELVFDVKNSLTLTDEEKSILIIALATRLTKDGVLSLFCSESRNQHHNKKVVINKFCSLLRNSMVRNRERKATRATYVSVQNRLENKKLLSVKKKNRRRTSFD